MIYRGAEEETRADVDLRLVPFDVDASYAVCRGLSHGRFVKRYWLSSVKNYQFIIVYAFSRLALGDGVTNFGSYSWKSTATSSSSVTHQSVEAQLGKELRQTKDLVQQLLQNNQQMQQGYQAMQYTMMQVIILRFTICQIPIFVRSEELIIIAVCHVSLGTTASVCSSHNIGCPTIPHEDSSYVNISYFDFS
jgi:hypothetical protein